MPDIARTLYQISIWALPAIFAITLHEAAHGFVARRLGDDTAYHLGRVSLNPIRHIDIFGTILLPVMLLLVRSPFMFGYAKPVPVNFRNLRNPRRDMMLVAIAGPATNFLLAAISALLANLLPYLPDVARPWAAFNLWNSITLNLILAVFNMIPLPPLDGGRVLLGLLPRPLAIPFVKLERFGMLILIGLIFLLPLASPDFDIFGWVLRPAVNMLLRLIAPLAGG